MHRPGEGDQETEQRSVDIPIAAKRVDAASLCYVVLVDMSTATKRTANRPWAGRLHSHSSLLGSPVAHHSLSLSLCRACPVPAWLHPSPSSFSPCLPPRILNELSLSAALPRRLSSNRTKVQTDNDSRLLWMISNLQKTPRLQSQGRSTFILHVSVINVKEAKPCIALLEERGCDANDARPILFIILILLTSQGEEEISAQCHAQHKVQHLQFLAHCIVGAGTSLESKCVVIGSADPEPGTYRPHF